MLEAQLSRAAKRLLVTPGPLPRIGDPEPTIACFVDLAQFTTISEALASDGTVGTERLVELINGFFAPAIELAERLGGDVVGFGGDALTVLFPAGSFGPAHSWASEVIASTGRLEAAETRKGTFRLQAKIGIADGAATTLLLGSAETGVAVTAGNAIDRAVQAEHRLRPGEVGALLGKGIPAGDTQMGNEVRGDVRLLDPAGRIQPDVSPPAVSVVDDGTIASFVPPPVIARMAAGDEALLDEHRPVTVLFIGAGTDPLYEDARSRDLLERSLPIVTDRGGTTIAVGSGDKGTTLLAAFGAPVAFAEQRSSAILTADEIAGRFGCRVGVSSGLCFAGRIGCDTRWNYNLLGDVVNTSARLMELSQPGQVLVDEPTFRTAPSRFRWSSPTVTSLRGRDQPVRTTVLDEVLASAETSADLPLTGRTDELAALRSVLLATAAGDGAALAIVGESGIGKTRLAAETADLAQELGLCTAHLGLSNRQAGRSYGAWMPVLLGLLDLSADVGPGEFQSGAMRQSGIGAPLAALIRDVIFGDPFENELLSGLAPSAAAEVVDNALAGLVLDRSADPLLIVADDAHDLDEASTRLLELISRRLPDRPVVLLLVTYPRQPTARWPWLERLELDELGRADAAALIDDHRRKQDIELSAEEQTKIIDLVGGNPQLLRMLTDYVGLDRGSGLPVDARAIVLGRFDRLPVGARSSLAKAATLGRHFSTSDFLGAFSQSADPLVLDDLVDQRMLEPKADGVLSFASPILRQVAYEASAHHSRMEFHRLVGLHIERDSIATLSARVEELAHHFGFTDDLERHRRYFGPAARRSRSAFANDRAISWFRRAIEVATGDDVPELRFDLGSAMEYGGFSAEALEQFELASTDPAIGPRALASRALLEASSAGYEPAREMIDRAVVSASERGDARAEEWVLERASLLHLRSGQPERAMEVAARQLIVAEQLGDQVRIAAALSNLGASKSWLGRLEAAESELSRSLEIAGLAGALALAAEIETDLGMIALDQGRLDDSLTVLESSLKQSRAVGYKRNEATALGNIALVLIVHDRHQEAAAPLRESLRLVVEMEDAISMAAVLGKFAMIDLAEERVDAAVQMLARVVRIGRHLGSQMYRERAYATLAEAYDAVDDTVKAAACRQQAEREEGEVTDQEIELVAPVSPLLTLDHDDELAELMVAVDELIERLGRDDR